MGIAAGVRCYAPVGDGALAWLAEARAGTLDRRSTVADSDPGLPDDRGSGDELPRSIAYAGCDPGIHAARHGAGDLRHWLASNRNDYLHSGSCIDHRCHPATGVHGACLATGCIRPKNRSSAFLDSRFSVYGRYVAARAGPRVPKKTHNRRRLATDSILTTIAENPGFMCT